VSWRGWLALLLAAGAAGVVAVAAAPARASATAAQIWAPFVLVTGLLLIGAAADADGLFAAGGDRLARLPGRPLTLFIAALALVAAVTAVLDLDTAVVFVTPVLLAAAASRGIDTRPFSTAAWPCATRPRCSCRALLVGLDVGPNLAVTGALSALLWLRVARNAGQRPSVKTYSLVGASTSHRSPSSTRPRSGCWSPAASSSSFAATRR
jgi:Na+/H+ antiporter NhaD/arsenite permease-like protein